MGLGYLSSCFFGPCIYKFIDLCEPRPRDGKSFRQPCLKLLFLFLPSEQMAGARLILTSSSPSPREQVHHRLADNNIPYALPSPASPIHPTLTYPCPTTSTHSSSHINATRWKTIKVKTRGKTPTVAVQGPTFQQTPLIRSQVTLPLSAVHGLLLGITTTPNHIPIEYQPGSALRFQIDEGIVTATIVHVFTPFT